MRLESVTTLKNFRSENNNRLSNNLHNSYDINQKVEIKRGDIYLVELTGITNICGESVQEKCRPYVVISNDMNNKYAPTVEVVPISSQLSKKYPQHVVIELKELNRTSIILTEQIVTINKSKLLKKIGNCPKSVIRRLDATLIKQMGIQIDAELIQQVSGIKQEIDWEHISDLVSTIKRTENSVRKNPSNKAFQTMERGLMKSLEKESKICNVSVNTLLSMYDVNGNRICEFQMI